ncbi:hypothetical protein P4H83_06705 [Paenibacillus favisporus]|uniref:hypothetical protein n=1 Tax=Paenibacillus favisporus TaxID=221028 RepID=UPI002DB92D93|nr:hypothetical protein [Paenibacillus favisporus]MEC0174560.1 hypothetical protein [Paenibacillus favisporus]
MKSLAELVVEYGDLQLIDAHNHDASGFTYTSMMKTLKQDSVDRIVLFGDALGDRHVAQQVAGGNLERLIRMQPATKTQLEALRKVNDLHGMKKDLSSLTKEEAGKLLSDKETDQ